MLAKRLEKTAKNRKKNWPSFQCGVLDAKQLALLTMLLLENVIPTWKLRRVFDPIDERWIFVDESPCYCLSTHENIKIIKNEGGEKK